MKRSQDIDLKTFYTSPRANQFSFYLFEVDAPECYQDWFEVIRNAGPDDLIKIHINSPGGRIDTTLQLVRALQDSQATVVTSVEGECASAATIVFLCADTFEVTPNSLFMFHNYSGGARGKGGEMYDKIVFEKDWLEGLMRDAYKNILTDEELERMLIGKDVYKTSAEMLEILQRRADIERAEDEALCATTEEEELPEFGQDFFPIQDKVQPE